MKTLILQFIWLFPLLVISQIKTGDDITISTPQNDDIYLAGKDISIDAAVKGDAVVAGSYITVNDTISQDLIVAGSDIIIKGYVADDIRMAGGKLTIDAEVGDDVIVAGGELTISKDAVIKGNLISVGGKTIINGVIIGMLKARAGELKMNGIVEGDAILYGEDIKIDGEIYGTSEIVAEELEIGENAQFHETVSYWTEDGQVEFKNSLVNTTANLEESLMEEHEEFPWKFFGIAAFGFWIFYLLSAFLVILILNYAFKNLFAEAVTYIDKEFWRSLGYGFIYLFGMPLLIVLSFVILIGIPVGLFLFSVFVFSVLFGHLIGALLLTYYLEKRDGQAWGYWKTSFIAMAFAIVIRLLTFIPFLGSLIAFLIMAIAYGLLAYTLWQRWNKNNIELAKE
ncbi:hypothetical protein [uncultured Eudoraea sp.]|uniref:hypothetical protein n=1 Tax=uncultured Eudoraea sp. TaxID=1035614 RepID=UPI0026221048|nr:hypothetical protein [uncultured Eudoraea sp.]